jgi:primosomal protein N' (replication factor Y) (superfamily II helicase)
MIVQVALPIPVTKTFSYSAPDSWQDILEPFQRVIVPFHDRAVTGSVTACVEGDGTGLKEVQEILDLFPLLNENLIRLGNEAARDCVTPLGLVLKYMLPPRLRLNGRLFVHHAAPQWKNLANLSLAGVVRRMGWKEAFRLARRGDLQLHDRFTNRPFGPFPPATETQERQRTLLVADMDGRMTAYAEAVAKAMAVGGNTLLLLPDHHAAGRYVYEHLSRLFPGRLCWYGSMIRYRARMETYFRARQEQGLVILGSISCVFLPIRDLTAIIVENPQEEDFRNEEGFRFSAVTMAMKRAEIEGANLLIGGFAPPLDLYHGALTGSLQFVDRTPPSLRRHVAVATERGAGTPGALPESLLAIVEEALRDRKKVAIYTPRRDYSSLIRCLACGKPFLCIRCEGHLSYKKGKNMLLCGRCGRSFLYEETCRHCGSDLITYSATGVEYLEEQLQSRFTGVQVVKVTGETMEDRPPETPGSLSGPAIVVGTQTLAKLYGMKADILLCLGWEELLRVGGYRAEEKVFQLFTNLQDALRPQCLYVAVDKKTAVDVDFFLDPKRFYEATLENRRLAEFPPFFRFFLLSWTGVSEKAGEAALERATRLMSQEGLHEAMSGPSKEKRGKAWGWKVVIRQEKEAATSPLIKLWDVPGVRVEADPLNL